MEVAHGTMCWMLPPSMSTPGAANVGPGQPQSRGLIYKMLCRNCPKFDLTFISQICVCAIHRMKVRTENARTRLFQM